MVIKRYQVIFLTFLLLPISAFAADNQCLDKTCVDVFTDQNQLIITAQKGAGKPASKPISKATKRPVPKVAKPKVVKPKVVKPKVFVKPKAIVPIKKPVKKPAKKVVKKSAPKTVAATSLSDRLSKALPTGGISYQPDFKPLIHTPVYFWNDLPSVFRTQVNLIGETIDVVLRPSYTWSFGDGSFLSTTDPGGPYPNGKITHIYSQPGIYPVLLTTTWNGSFTHNAVERAITGEIKKVSALTITVVAAPTRFMN
mgnify:CR=1 FL=1